MENVKFSPDQQEAKNKIGEFLTDLEQREYILTGSPGMGKSFLTNYIHQMAVGRSMKCILSATTNKATAVIRDFSGTDAYTIHKVLNLRVHVDYVKNQTSLVSTNGDKFLDQYLFLDKLLIIDEASMIDAALKEKIDETLDKYPRLKILYVGDKNQVPPVNSENMPVFSSNIPRSELTTCHRQKEGSTIIPTATALKKIISDSEFRINRLAASNDIILLDKQEFLGQMEAHFKAAVLLNDPNHVKALAYTNNTVNEFNKLIRQYFYTGKHYQEGEILVANKAYIPNEDVMLNNEEFAKVVSDEFEVYEELDCRKLTLTKLGSEKQFTAYTTNQVGKKAQIRKQLIAEKRYNRLRTFMESFIDVRPVYSSTIHKAQGSTFGNVFLHLEDLGKCPNYYDIPRLVYVALTRAQNNVFVYGELPDYMYHY